MKTKLPALLLLLLMIGACLPHARGDQPTRAAFAAAVAKVTKGMGANEVEALLGKPDDVITQTDPVGNDDDPTAEYWCYGTDGHLTFATLGNISMSHGKVVEMWGWTGAPPDASMFAEPELRRLLRAIDACRQGSPLRFIQAVNMLQPLGKEKALAALAEYYRVDSPPFGARGGIGYDPACLIMRLLFDTPPPDPATTDDLFEGAPNPPAPKDPTVMPYFPFAVVDGIPVYMVFDFYAGNMYVRGTPVDYFRKNGVMRKHLLVPGNDPLPVLPALVQSPQWTFPTRKNKDGSSLTENGKELVAQQLLRLIDTVYRVERDRDGYLMTGRRMMDPYWVDVTKQVAALNIHWDAEKQMYVFPDGHTLPDDTPPIYKRQIWELPFAKVPSRLIFSRRAKDYIVISFVFPREVYNPIPDSLITVRTTGQKPRQLLQFKISYSAKQGEIVTHFWNREIDLNAGGSLQAAVAMDGKTVTSPVFTP